MRHGVCMRRKIKKEKTNIHTTVVEPSRMFVQGNRSLARVPQKKTLLSIKGITKQITHHIFHER